MNNNHLTSEQMEALLSDPESRDRSQHLSVCETCSAELESLLAGIGDLRSAVIASAALHRKVAVLPTVSHRSPRVMWTVLAAAAFLCVVGPIAMHQKQARVITVNTSSQQVQAAVSDEQLMSNIQDDLSSSVPKPMLPLAASASSTGAATTTYNSRYNSKENE